MAGYRVGIDLALPAFDTYRCLEKFARNPRSRSARAAYRRLWVRTRDCLLYDALSHVRSFDIARALLGIRTGISREELSAHLFPDSLKPETSIGAKDLSTLDEAGRRALFEELCRRHGIRIDHSDSISESSAAIDTTC